jgi:hypothetical protein|tara:strand:- start:427 stop:948 length:522 start_codon:yes stop_codon:yes gene_type:complete
MYIPKIKQIVGGKIPGKLIDIKTGLRFGGKFVQDFKGNFFKGEKITSKSETLKFVPDSKAEEETLGLRTVYRQPSSADYAKGTFDRFFVKDGPSGRVVEVDKSQYLEQKKSGKLYRRVLRIQWYITGNPEDQTINGYLYPGTKKKNQDVINQAEKILPGIQDQVLTDSAQFVK